MDQGGRAFAPDHTLDRILQDTRDEVHEQDAPEQHRLPPQDRCDQRENDPDGAELPDPGEEDEQVVEGLDSVLDDPALETAIEPDQTGTSLFADSISCSGSNGFPTN